MKLHLNGLQGQAGCKHAITRSRLHTRSPYTPAHAHSNRSHQQCILAISQPGLNVSGCSSEQGSHGSPDNIIARRSTAGACSATAAKQAARGSPAVHKTAMHLLPSKTSGVLQVQQFTQAAAAAEASQAQLLQRKQSHLGHLFNKFPRLEAMAQVYSQVQKLHHQAIQQKLQQYGSIAATLPGFASAVLSEAAGQHALLKPGDTLQIADFLKLLTKLAPKEPVVEQGPSAAPQPLAQLARDLAQSIDCGSFTGPATAERSTNPGAQLDDIRLLVLPDLLTLLLDSLSPRAAEAAGDLPTSGRLQHVEWMLPAQGGSPLLSKAGDTATAKGSISNSQPDDALLITEQLVSQLLQQGKHQGDSNGAGRPVRLLKLDALAQQLTMRSDELGCYHPCCVPDLWQHDFGTTMICKEDRPGNCFQTSVSRQQLIGQFNSTLPALFC